MTDETVESYPRQSARTQRYTLGEPRDVTVSPDGRRIVFLRSRGPIDPVNCLWVVDASTGEERLVADPDVLLRGRDDTTLPPEELARRERAREAAAGITTYATDAQVTVTAFAIAGRLFVAGLLSGQARELPVAGPVFDPRPDPLARRVAYVSGRLLCIGELDGRWDVLAGDDPDEPETVTWGSADFIAAEEMDRFRGYWWSPDGAVLAVTRVDTAPVPRWHVGDPAQPETPPTELAYPAAGTANADVTLHLVALDGTVVDVEWDRARFPYLVDVHWTADGLIITVQRRDQRVVEVLEVDPATGSTELRWADMDDQWVELVPGAPRLAPDGVLITCADRDGARRLLVDGEPVTPTDLQVRAIETVDGPGVVFLANPIDDATVLHVWRWMPDGQVEALTDEPGVHTVAAGGGTIVVRTATLAEPGAHWGTLDGVELVSFAATPVVRADVHLSFLGDRRIATAVLLPAEHDGSPLPVLVDPYGGPHAGRVVRVHNAHVGAQWMADQGFAVVVADGRGTPGRGSAWERAVHLDLASGSARGPGRGPPAGRRRARGPRPRPRGDPGLELRRVPRRPRRAAASGRLPRRHRRRAGDRVAPLRHPLHRALSGRSRRASRRLRRQLVAPAGEGLDPAVAPHPRPRRRQRRRRPHPAPVVGAAGRRPAARSAAARRGHPHDAAGGRGREPAAAPGRLPAPGARSRCRRCCVGLRCAVMEKRLSELYEGVAVHVTADREHMAALELLALVMLADSHLSDDELDVLRELTEDWRGSAFSFEQYLGPAVAKARAAFASHTVTDLLDDIDARITSRILRKALFSAARQMVGDEATTGGGEPPVRRRGPLRLSSPIWAGFCQIDFWAGFLSDVAKSRPDHGRRATATRSRPARSGRISMSANPAGRSSCSTAGP